MAGWQSLLGGAVRVNATGLTRISKDVEGIVDAVLRKGAIDIEATAKDIAQQKGIFDTGDLIDSIQVWWERSKKLFYEIGPRVHYGIYQEFGTVRFAGRPYMVPALNKHRPFILRAAKQAIEQGGSN